MKKTIQMLVFTALVLAPALSLAADTNQGPETVGGKLPCNSISQKSRKSTLPGTPEEERNENKKKKTDTQTGQ